MSGEGRKARLGRRLRAALVALPFVVIGWLALSHFVVRPAIEERIAGILAGEARVKTALLWPTLDATAFGVTVETEHHRLAAARVTLGLSLWGIFGGRMLTSVDVHGLGAEFDEGEPVRLLAWSQGGEGEGGGGDEPDFDLEPMRVPPLAFHGPRILLRSEAGSWEVFATGRVDARQVGDRSFAVEAGPGVLATVPFEKLTTRLIPRAGHLLLSQLKLRAFNGMLGGILDVDTVRAGAFNGEIEWHFAEVEEVWTTYRLPYAEKRRGDLSGRVVFRGARPSLDALEGQGTVRLQNASFFSPLSFRVFLVLKVPVAAEAPLTRGEMAFSFEQSLLYLESARFFARDFELEGQGILSLDGRADLEIGHGGTTVAVSGRLEDPTIKVLPFDHLTLPFDRIFRERIR